MNTAVCTHCQAINRIPDDRLQDAAKCGRCGHELFDGSHYATGETLDKLLTIASGDRLLGLVRPFAVTAPIFEDYAQKGAAVKGSVSSK